MTQAPFDPYYKWLGIRPKDQPPNHYRLLAIDLFESDLEVIEQGADRQMAHVRTFQTGQHSELSQKLLNEIAAARVCLLNPEKKADYDRMLRERLAAEQPRPSPPQPGPVQPPAAVGPTTLPRPASPVVVAPLPVPVAVAPQGEYAEVDAFAVRRAIPARRSNATGLVAGASTAVIVLLAAVGVIAWQFQGQGPARQQTVASVGRPVDPLKPSSPNVKPGADAAPRAPGSGRPRVGPAAPGVQSTDSTDSRPSIGRGRQGDPAGTDASATAAATSSQSATPAATTPAATTPATTTPETPAATTTTPPATMPPPERPPANPLSPVMKPEPGVVPGGGAIDRIVLWNEHNAAFNNSGTRTCNLILLRGDNEVWRQNDVSVPWQPGRDASCEVSVPGVRADKLRVEVTAWLGNSGGLSEVEIFAGGNNLARGQPATASEEHRPGDSRSAGRLTDGITTSAQDNTGYWLLPVGRSGWADIRLAEESPDQTATAADDGEPELGDSPTKSGKPERKTRKNAGRSKASKFRIVQTVLRKKLHGRASFNANTGELTVVYDFANKDQLKDFGATDADEFTKGSFQIKANETRRHCVKYQTLVVAGAMLVSQQEGLHLQTTEGVRIRGFGTRSLSLEISDNQRRSSRMTTVSVPMEQLVVPFAMDVTPLHIGFQAGGKTLSSSLNRGGIPMAGQLELCGGDGGNAFSGLTISGVVDLEWAKTFFEP